jgi:16S rRNA (uracil1498-N3)-methyltransferase
VRIPRIYTEQPLTAESRIDLEPEPSHHLSQVLRLAAGAELRLFNGNGEEYAGHLYQLSKQQVVVELGPRLRSEPFPPLQIHLQLGISRGERMEFALQKAVELGVFTITPLFSERCVVKLTGKRLQQRLQHWRRLIINACEQSGRCRIPQLHAAQGLTESLFDRPPGIALLLDPRSPQTLRDLRAPMTSLTLLAGPEGGLSEQECELAISQHFQPICLGPRILRSETAPLAAIAAVQILWGDFR